MAQPVAGAFLSSRLCRAGRSLLSTLGHPETVRHYFVCRGGPFPFATRPDARLRRREHTPEPRFNATRSFPDELFERLRRSAFGGRRTGNCDRVSSAYRAL